MKNFKIEFKYDDQVLAFTHMIAKSGGEFLVVLDDKMNLHCNRTYQGDTSDEKDESQKEDFEEYQM